MLKEADKHVKGTSAVPVLPKTEPAAKVEG